MFKLARQARHLSTQARSDPREYHHDEVGYNYRMVNLLAAMGVAQMEQLAGFVAHKQATAQHYYRHLTGVGDLSFQGILPDTKPNQWLFTIRTQKRFALQAYLAEQGIESRPLWVPMNRLQMFREVPYYHRHDLSNQLYGECLSIPCSTSLSEEQRQFVSDAICKFFEIN